MVEKSTDDDDQDREREDALRREGRSASSGFLSSQNGIYSQLSSLATVQTGLHCVKIERVVVALLLALLSIIKSRFSTSSLQRNGNKVAL